MTFGFTTLLVGSAFGFITFSMHGTLLIDVAFGSVTLSVVLLYVGFNILFISKNNEEMNSSLYPRVAAAFLIRKYGACLLNKHQQQRQNNVGMRVERLHKMMEGEYACCIRWVMEHSDQRECINIISIYEQRIREVLGFYVLGMWTMK